MTRKIIIDCDPGQDDAVALFLAFASPELEILGITTVGGNVPLELTHRNARMMCDIAETEVPVYAGCDKPMRQPLRTAEYIHGDTGINGIDVFEPRTPLRDKHGVDFIVETLLTAEDDSITLVPTGPLTNIGTAVSRDSAILQKIERIVLMGGAMREGGNRTPSAEFNILVDPDAADIVFRCGRPIVQMGLDVTHQVLSTQDRIDRIRALDNPVAEATAGMISFFERYDMSKYSAPGAPLHDPCTIAWLIKPELFTGKDCNVAIEARSELTLGHTAVDFWHVTDRPKNVHWIHEVDSDGFYDLLTERLAGYGENI